MYHYLMAFIFLGTSSGRDSFESGYQEDYDLQNFKLLYVFVAEVTVFIYWVGNL